MSISIDPLGAAKETGGVLKSILGWMRGKARRPKLKLWPEVGETPFRYRDESGQYQGRPGSFLWINVRNEALSPHSTARGVIGHIFVSDQHGEIYRMRARWRGSPHPSVAPDADIDRFNIGPGFTEQLDLAWKFPGDDEAWGFNSEVLLRHPETWKDDRYRLDPSLYTVRVKVEPLNGTSVERSFPLIVVAGQPLRLGYTAGGTEPPALGPTNDASPPVVEVGSAANETTPDSGDAGPHPSAEKQPEATRSPDSETRARKDSPVRHGAAEADSQERTQAPTIPRSTREPHFDRGSGGEPTVAVRYTGDGSTYIAALPADPTRTTYVTPGRAAELVNAGIYEYGEAPEVPDEAGKAMNDAIEALAGIAAEARKLEARIRALDENGRDSHNEAFWVLQVRNFEADVQAFTTAHLAPDRRDGLSGTPPATKGLGWPETLARYMAARAEALEDFLPAIQRVDIGFGPRIVDPTTVFSTTDPKSGLQVTLRADHHGRLWPRTRGEAAELDRTGRRRRQRFAEPGSARPLL